MPAAAAGKQAVSGWAVAGFVGALLLVPLVPVVCGFVALVKIERRRGRLGGGTLATAAVWLGCLELIALPLAAVVLPAIAKDKVRADLCNATSDLRQAGLLMFEFDRDWGEFPSHKVFEENRAKFPGLNEADDANFYLGMLIAGGYTSSEEIFYAKGGSARDKRPDNVIAPPERLLEAGECGFGYVMLAGGRAMSSGDNSGRPLLVTPLRPGTGGSLPRFNPRPYDQRAVYVGLDQSHWQARVDPKTGLARLFGSSKTLFENGDGTVWGKDVPEVKLPR